MSYAYRMRYIVDSINIISIAEQSQSCNMLLSYISTATQYE